MLTQPRNYKIMGVELNWARLDQPVNPFGTPQWELQIATTDANVAKELSDNHLNVKEKDDKFVVSCLLYTSPSPRDRQKSRMPSSD